MCHGPTTWVFLALMGSRPDMLSLSKQSWLARCTSFGGEESSAPRSVSHGWCSENFSMKQVHRRPAPSGNS